MSVKKINLFCLPFAGGSSYAYKSFSQSFNPEVKLVAIELPGRGKRISEPLLYNIYDIVADVFEQIKDQLHQPFAIYGHSMGTLIGFLLTRRMIQQNYPLPKHLFFSGSGGPSCIEDRPIHYSLPYEEFIDALKKMGGAQDEILTNPEMMKFFEPILRADFQAVETYQYEEGDPFDIPITCMLGTEERTSYAEALQWQKESIHPVAIRQFPGNHFFIFDFEETIGELISSALRNVDIEIQ